MFRVEDFVVLALSVFSITVLIKDTDGPFHIFSNTRDRLTFRHNETARPFWKELFSCPWCIGTWVSIFVSILYWLIYHCSVPVAVAYWIASIGVTGFLYAMLYSFVSD